MTVAMAWLSPARAEAASITFVFDCVANANGTDYPPADADTCSSSTVFGAGPFGMLTLTDAGDRVDIDWTMTPPFGAHIERVLLNFNPTYVPADAQLWLVPQGAPAGSTTEITGVTSIIPPDGNGQGQPIGSTWSFDIRVNEDQPAGLTFSGSLYVTRAGVGVNLSVNDFLALSSNAIAAWDGLPPLYAFYTTINCLPATNPNPNCGLVPGTSTPNTGEFWAGATSYITAVPEPGTLVLFGGGLLGLVAIARRRLKT